MLTSLRENFSGQVGGQLKIVHIRKDWKKKKKDRQKGYVDGFYISYSFPFFTYFFSFLFIIIITITILTRLRA